jgi:hypothetical protein
MSTETRVREIGDRLELAFAADLRAHPRVAPAAAARAAPRRAQRRAWLATRRRRWLTAAVATAIAAPGVAYAAGAFTIPQTVARSLPAGARIFGSKATCSVVRRNVEYRCTLAKAPAPDPVTHLTPQQWRKYLATPPNLGKVTFRKRRVEVAPGKWQTLQFAEDLPRIERISREYRNKVLASFGFTPAQIDAHNAAIDAGAAGVGAGRFKGTVEPTVNAAHRIDGGCRAISPDGVRWECYVGKAAVTERILGPGTLGQYVSGPGVG